MVKPEDFDRGYPNFQLGTRDSGSRRNLDYLLSRRTLSSPWGRSGNATRPRSKAPAMKSFHFASSTSAYWWGWSRTSSRPMHRP